MENTGNKKTTENTKMIDFLKAVNKSDARRRLIPMEFASGWPSVSIKNKRICVTVPYFMPKPAEGGKAALFPPAYVLILTWPNASVVEFSSLAFRKEYADIDFTRPTGLFRHEAVANMTKEEYAAKRKELFIFYDELISCISERREFTREDDMRELFAILMEPSLYPMYKHIAERFYKNYCGL